MSQKTFFLFCATVFFLVAAAHLTRLIFRWEIVISGWTVPHWISVPGLIISSVLSTWGFGLASRTKPTE